MTDVRFYLSSDGFCRSFETKGHAGHGTAGNDIVCAAVSAATELVMTVLDRFSVDIVTDIRPEEAYVCCRLSPITDAGTRQAVGHVLDGYRDYLSEVSKEYPKHLKCSMITE